MKKQVATILFFGGMVLLSYNNCSAPEHQVTNPASSSLALGATACEDALINTYALGYQQFLSTNCKNCHITGPGKGAFASSDTKISYDAFTIAGYDKVSQYAVNPNHNSPYTGPQHQQEISGLKVQWNRALEEFAACGGTVPTSNTTKFDFKTMSFMKPMKIPDVSDGKEKTVFWNMATDFSGVQNPDYAGAQFTVTMKQFVTSTGEKSYTLSRPTITGNTNDLQVKGIFVKINGIALRYIVTYAFVDFGVHALSNTTTGLLSSGSMVIPGTPDPRDEIEIGFVSVSKATLPAPTLPPVISLQSPANMMAPKGDYDLTVSLSNPSNNPVTVAVSVDDTCATNAACSQPAKTYLCTQITCTTQEQNLAAARSVLGQTYNRYDWDYKINAMAVTFLPGQVSKVIRLNFSSDIRKEGNRLLSLTLNNPSGGSLGSSRSNFVIRKLDNPTPPPGFLTYTQLMSSSALIFSNCTRCHNSSVDQQGGFDINDYEGMIQKSVLIPGSNLSKLYRRMLPPEANVQAMPIDGPLINEKLTEVEAWILNGAPNN